VATDGTRLGTRRYIEKWYGTFLSLPVCRWHPSLYRISLPTSFCSYKWLAVPLRPTSFPPVWAGHGLCYQLDGVANPSQLRFFSDFWLQSAPVLSLCWSLLTLSVLLFHLRVKAVAWWVMHVVTASDVSTLQRKEENIKTWGGPRYALTHW
jgi:hypothetical protein